MQTLKCSAKSFVCIIFIGILSTGCVAYNPYVEPEMPRPGLKRDGQGKPQLDENKHGQPTTVTVSQAREYARSLQDAYRRAAANYSKTRTVLDMTVIGSAAAAIGLAATGGSSEVAGLLGLSAGTLTLSGNRLLVAIRKKIYFQGALALECVIGAAAANSVPNLMSYQLSAQLSLLAAERLTLETVMSKFIAKIEAVNARLTQRDRSSATAIVEEGKHTVILAKSIEKIGLEFLDSLNPLGQILLSKVEEIRLHVDAEIAKSEPDLLGYDEALRGLLTSTSTALVSPDVAGSLLPPAEEKPVEFSSTFELPDKELAELYEELNTAIDNVKQAHREVSTMLATMDTTSITFPPNLFTNCSLNNRIGSGPLRLSKNSIEIARGTDAQLQVRVLGGRPPYQVMAQGVASQDVLVTLVPDDSGGTLSVVIPSKFTLMAASPIVISVTDSDENSRNLLITLKATEQASDSTNNRIPDLSLARIQKFLIKEMGDNAVGPNLNDGFWGKDTEDAIIKYLSDTDNFKDLKESDDFKEKFKDATSPPDFSKETEKMLRNYMEILIDK